MSENEYPLDVGDYFRADVSACSQSARVWYSRGMAWAWAFHHEEAILCFESALLCDPTCAMAHFGISYSHGPDYNVSLENYYPDLAASPGYPSMEAAHFHAAAAQRCCDESGASEVVRDLVNALSRRVAWPMPEGGVEGLRELSESFAEAMRSVWARHPDDADVAVFLAEALMGLAPWKLFAQRTYAPHPVVAEVRAALEAALSLAPGHAGACHFLIHLCEMSTRPEDALPACTSLLSASGAAERPHLLHMPTHIFVLLGRYQEAVEANAAAVRANSKLYALEIRRGTTVGTDFYLGYAAHDAHMLVYAAMLGGAEATARHHALQLCELLPVRVLQREGMAAGLEAFHATISHVLVRFGRWDEILATPLPEDAGLFAATTATLRYARVVALAALGRPDEAEAEEAAFAAAAARLTPPSVGAAPEIVRTVHNNSMGAILGVAKAVARAEVLYRRGRMQQLAGTGGAAELQEAFAVLRRATKLEDDLAYDEPWGWMVPVRHALGGLLLEQDRLEEASATYRADLSGVDVLLGAKRCSESPLARHNRHPENIWSLVGLAECLDRGAARNDCDGDCESSEAMAARVSAAASFCDCKVLASCACVVSKPSPTAVQGGCNTSCTAASGL